MMIDIEDELIKFNLSFLDAPKVEMPTRGREC